MTHPDLIRMRDPERSIEARMRHDKEKRTLEQRVAKLEAENAELTKSVQAIRRWASGVTDALNLPTEKP